MNNEYTKVSRRDFQVNGSRNTLNVTDDINRTDIVKMNDEAFFDKVMFNFDNNRYANALFINDIKDREYSDFSKCENIKFNRIESCIELSDLTKQGTYITSVIKTNEKELTRLNDFFLIVKEHKPGNTDILYFLVNEKGEEFPIRPNYNEPMTIRSKDSQPCCFRIKAVIKTNGIKSPKINGLAVLYYDKFVDMQLGLIHPDFSEEVEETPVDDEEIILTRDPLQDDKLVEISDIQDCVKLVYDESGEKLVDIETYDQLTGVLKERVSLLYGDYENSKGLTEEVLVKVRTRRDFSDEVD